MKRMDAGGYAACFNHEQLALMCANSDRTIDRLGAENKQLKDENAKLREFAAHMANALGIDREWCDTSWCDTDCMVEFGCQTAYCCGETRCPAFAMMTELGIEVTS